MKNADRALILDGNGNAFLHASPSTLILPSYISEDFTQSDQNSATAGRAQELYSTATAAAPVDPGPDEICQHDGFDLLKFIFGSTRIWMLIVWVLALILQVVTERFPGKDTMITSPPRYV